MKRLAVLGAALVLAGACASSHDAPAAPGAASAGDPRIGELQTSMTELLERLDVLNDRIAHLEQAGEQRMVPSPVSGAQPQAQTSVVKTGQGPALHAAPPAAQAPATVAARAVINAEMAEQYRSAIVLFGKNQLPAARAAFQRVFDADPTGDLADNALFWIGETLYAEGKYADAARFYKRVGDDYADQNKAPDALFKLALTYEKSGDLILARTALQEVVKRYPYSAPAGSAKAELNRIRY